MLTKARVRLNARRLYAADISAVRELLKLAGLLRRAAQSAEPGGEVGRRFGGAVAGGRPRHY
jgi:hypothetical protein